MDRFYQLLDMTSGNLAAEFESEEEVIESLREVQKEDGDGPILELALFLFEDGHPTLVAKERDLVLYVTRARKLDRSRAVKTA